MNTCIRCNLLNNQWNQSTNANGSKSYIYIDKQTNRVYGNDSKDSICSIRAKMFGIFLFIVPWTTLRAIGRTYYLLSGDFLIPAYENAALEILNTNCDPSSVNEVYARHILWQLAKHVTQVVTLPIFLIAAMGSCLYGLIDPLEGRALFANIEELWSRENTRTTSCEIEMACLDYLAPCMQPKDVAKRNNFYRFYPEYDPSCIRSLLLKIENEFLDKQKLFQRKKLINFKATSVISNRKDLDKKTLQTIIEKLKSIDNTTTPEVISEVNEGLKFLLQSC